ncbi:MAG: hypothetical protein EOP07_04125 [Proteobacteria bacterium]|nr:MAG: hypothetical protein EOP07_04125 [Pseudomonadota bacterium]
MSKPLFSRIQSKFAVAFLFGAVAMMGGACEKTRSLKFLQGQGENLYTINDFNEQTFKVKTGENRFKGQTSRADKLMLIDDFRGVNNLDAVDFKIEDGLFAGIDLSDYNFYGRANSEYTLKYSFTNNYVVLSKVASKLDIPSQELTYAKDLGNDMYEVPMMGLPINLYAVEKVRDDRGKDTRRIATYSKDYLADAQAFKINENSVRYFAAPLKQDLFKADFFKPTDEWFYTKTLVGRGLKSKSILGSTSAELKIKFARTNNSIIGVDLNIAAEQEILDPTKTITALEIPVEWADFRTESAGTDARLKEIKLGDSEGESRFWEQREWALVDFNNVDRLSKSYTADNKLEKLEVGNDYISFTIYESSTGDTYKYSLAKSNDRVEGQRMYADDTKLFHIFAAKRTVIAGQLYTQQPDFNKLVFANRFYPKNGEIVYHISNNTPNLPEFTDAIADSIKAWDAAFTEADTGIRVRLDPLRTDPGDVRYNQVVFYGYEIDSSMETGGTLLGFGPSVQDSRSGETYAAATHIYLRAYREGIIRGIRSFVRNELGLYDDKKVNDISFFKNADAAAEAGAMISSAIPDITPIAALYDSIVSQNGFDGLNNLRNNFAAEISNFRTPAQINSILAKNAEKTEMELTQNKNGAVCDYATVAASANSWAKIRDKCMGGKTPFSDYLDRVKAAHAADPKVLNLDNGDVTEEQAILACAQPLMKDLLTSTLIHEIGHNLGLGHNFAGSSDSDNFAKDSTGKTAYPSSSVMDYPDRDFDLYSKAGPYDVAAIRYLYGRKVETTQGQMLDVPNNKSIYAVASEAGSKLKGYEVCNDTLNRSNQPYYNPQCLKWDVGGTPKDYVTWAARQIHADIITNGYVYNDSALRGASSSTSYFFNFKQIHDYWRYLMYQDAGKNLEKLSEAELKAYIERRSKTDKVFAKYTDATNEIFKLSMEILKLPSRICVVRDSASGSILGLQEFRRLRSDIFLANNYTPQNCQEALPYVASVRPEFANRSLKLEDKGVEIKALELDLDPAAAADKLKGNGNFGGMELNPSYSYGTQVLKTAAMNLLMNRTPMTSGTTKTASLQLLVNTSMLVNFLDVPWYRNEIADLAMNQLVAGANMEQLGLNAELGKSFYPFFEENSEVATLFTSTMIANAGNVDQSPARALTDSFIATRSIVSGGVTGFLQSTLSSYAGQLDEVFYAKKAGTVVYAAPTQARAGKVIRRYAMMKQVANLATAKQLLADVSTTAAPATAGAAPTAADMLRAVTSRFEANDLFLQAFQYDQMGRIINQSTLAGVAGVNPELVKTNLTSLASNALGWDATEFQDLVNLRATDPNSFSAQLKVLESLIQSVL